MTDLRRIEERRSGARVYSAFVDTGRPSDMVDRIVRWGIERRSAYVCYVNVHSLVTAAGDQDLRAALAAAELALPDGAPVAWTLRRKGYPRQERLSGPDMMLAVCAEAAQVGLPVFFFGSTRDTLDALQVNLVRLFPGLRVAGVLSPPFRAPTPEEDDDFVQRINASEAGLVFVGLGCPRQERWMLEHRGRVQGVMLGVGAAFDFHAGMVSRAPTWMRQAGLEWLHRLLSEPRRLWRRYFVTNSKFVLWTLRDWAFGDALDCGGRQD